MGEQAHAAPVSQVVTADGGSPPAAAHLALSVTLPNASTQLTLRVVTPKPHPRELVQGPHCPTAQRTAESAQGNRLQGTVEPAAAPPNKPAAMQAPSGCTLPLAEDTQRGVATIDVPSVPHEALQAPVCNEGRRYTAVSQGEVLHSTDTLLAPPWLNPAVALAQSETFTTMPVAALTHCGNR